VENKKVDQQTIMGTDGLKCVPFSEYYKIQQNRIKIIFFTRNTKKCEFLLVVVAAVVIVVVTEVVVVVVVVQLMLTLWKGGLLDTYLRLILRPQP
jgi:hypothetical protein